MREDINCSEYKERILAMGPDNVSAGLKIRPDQLNSSQKGHGKGLGLIKLENKATTSGRRKSYKLRLELVSVGLGHVEYNPQIRSLTQ